MKSILKYVNNSKSLIEYLEKELNWPINLEDVEDEEDLYFEYTAAELGIKSEDLVAKIENIKQLRPITYNQPWGVFIIEFEKKKIPVTALRKILSTLIPSKRKENLEHEIWNKENLLFFCFFGNADERSIGIAKFTDNKNMLPTLKVLSWNPYIENENVLMRYEEKFNCLKWLDQDDIQIWKSQWSKFFTRENGQVVRDSRLLARELANLSKETKKAIVEFYKIEEEKGYLHKLYVKFRC